MTYARQATRIEMYMNWHWLRLYSGKHFTSSNIGHKGYSLKGSFHTMVTDILWHLLVDVNILSEVAFAESCLM